MATTTLTPAQDRALKTIRTRGVYVAGDGHADIAGSGGRVIQRRVVNSLFDKELVRFDTIETNRVVPA